MQCPGEGCKKRIISDMSLASNQSPDTSNVKHYRHELSLFGIAAMMTLRQPLPGVVPAWHMPAEQYDSSLGTVTIFPCPVLPKRGASARA